MQYQLAIVLYWLFCGNIKTIHVSELSLYPVFSLFLFLLIVSQHKEVTKKKIMRHQSSGTQKYILIEE